MTLRARLSAAVVSLLLAMVSLTGPLAAPAQAGYTTLCWGYQGCASQGMTASGYAKVSGTMFWRMYAGHNCTNYVAYRMVKSGMPNERPWSGSGNAENWGLAMASITDQTPTVGAVAWWKQNVWPAGSAGHVAYVEKVVSPTEIIVSQDSWGGDFSWARITKGSGWPNGFIHFNDRTLTNTAAPTLSGQARVGETLTATPGTWSPSDAKVTYQWLADGVAIPGATAATLALTADHLGSAMSVRVTARKQGLADASAVSPATAAVVKGTIANEAPPAVAGEPVVDEVLEVDPGAWSPEPETLRYQWKADGVAITGARDTTLSIGPELVGKALSVTTTAVSTGFVRTKVHTDATDPVAPGTLTVTAPHALTGTPRLDEVLTFDAGTVTPAATRTIRWLRDGQVVEEAAGTSYRLTPADLGSHITAQVTYERPGYTTLPLVSEATSSIKSISGMRLSTTPGRRKLTLSAKVAAPGVESLTGTLRVQLGRTVLAEVPVVDGVATTTVKGLEAGRQRIRVRYLGTDSTTNTETKRWVRIL